MRVMAGLGMSRLEQLVQGKEPCDSATTPAQRNCRDVRLRKAQGLLVSAISDEVLLRYEDIVFKADPILLWDRIYQDFGRGAGVNTDMVLADLYARKLQPDETVEKYINDLLRMQRILAENNDPIADCRIARLMLTNAMKVYPKITDDVTRRGMQSDDFTIYASRAELVNAEMTARAREQHDAPLTAGRGLSSARPQQANSVQHGGKGRGKKAKQNGGKYGGSRARSASCGSSSSSKASSLAAKKKITRCKVCNELGHWKGDKECSGVARQAASNNQQVVEVTPIIKTTSLRWDLRLTKYGLCWVNVPSNRKKNMNQRVLHRKSIVRLRLHLHLHHLRHHLLRTHVEV
ncbi:hypothetical protein PF004_g3109 [Phytophthora fragariae]|nr:hypothetical protein PF004_g3109 [Phytophthora fragariae]